MQRVSLVELFGYSTLRGQNRILYTQSNPNGYTRLLVAGGALNLDVVCFCNVVASSQGQISRKDGTWFG